ncbi:hypothetical protein K7X08_033848 [Anisodus acutangulus]|uniref:Uncharacterized protein n=1 Tax=Anisodus acutangulus TaxID=402998 RepID=A0A9Q1RCJ2_9SOLA|nr:hypothetical protein K7X08_033848 [Anisodus acutangulus]
MIIHGETGGHVPSATATKDNVPHEEFGEKLAAVTSKQGTTPKRNAILQDLVAHKVTETEIRKIVEELQHVEEDKGMEDR